MRGKFLTNILKKQFFCNIFLRKFAPCKSKSMIQRIQTVHLLVVAIISGVIPYFFPIAFLKNNALDVSTNTIFAIGFGLISLLALISIFSFKKRKKQFVINRINILFNLILLGVLAYRVLNSSGENSFSEKGVSVFVPIISIVFLFLANKAILRDENLVKSADRLR